MNEESKTSLSQSQVNLKLSLLERACLTQEDHWKEHDKRSAKNWEDIGSKLDKIVTSVDSVKSDITDIKVANAEKPCEAHAEKMKGLEGSVKLLSTIVISVVLLGIVLGLWVNGV